MDLYELKPGDRARTINDDLVEILSATDDGAWIKVRYIESNDHPELVGTDDLCSQNELVDRL